MSELLDLQHKHTTMLARFILAGNERGYKFTWGDAFRDPRAIFPYSHRGSLHHLRLAVDLNAFKNGVMLHTDEDWKELSELWITLGGTRIPGDTNHLSIKYQGRK